MAIENWDELEIIRPLQKESEPAGEIELEKSLPELTPEANNRRKKLSQTLKAKLMSMALAGFITLGGPLESYADQLKVTKKDKGAPEFVLESGITDEKLKKFEERLRQEEPEFIEWFYGYRDDFMRSLDEYESSVRDRVGKDNKEDQEGLRKLTSDYISTLSGPPDDVQMWTKEANEKLDFAIESGEDLLSYLDEHPNFIAETNNLVRKTLDSILLSAVLLDDSPEMRKKLMEFSVPPKIKISFFHPSMMEGTGAFAIPTSEEVYEEFIKTKKLPENSDLAPELIINPMSFYPSIDRNAPDKNYYQNIFVHELLHTFYIADDDVVRWFKINEMQSILYEGITQNRTLEITQYLKSKNIDITPNPGAFYDDRVVIASILESLIRSGAEDRDILSRWHGMLVEDDELIKAIRISLRELKLDETIANDFANIKTGAVRYPISSSTDLLTTLLAKLRLNGVSLSPDFVQGILVAGRLWDDDSYYRIHEVTQGWMDYTTEKEYELSKKHKNKK